MEAYVIEGAPNAGKSTLIYAQYLRLMNSNNYKLVESEYPHALTGFRLLIENIYTRECIYFNSPTDDKACINQFKDFFQKHSIGYNITKIVTSCRDDNNSHLKALVISFVKSLNLTNPPVIINLTPLVGI